MQVYFSNATLLKIPGKRAAYSDRTAYMMAEMSRLAYFRFEGGQNITEILESIKELTSDSSKIAGIEAILKASLVPGSEETGKKLLGDILKPQGYELVETFNNPETGTQAFICRNTTENFAVLAFRGTEPSLKDIKADIKANLVETMVGTKTIEMHSGYLRQFKSIQGKIETTLEDPKLEDHQIFFHGSLPRWCAGNNGDPVSCQRHDRGLLHFRFATCGNRGIRYRHHDAYLQDH